MKRIGRFRLLTEPASLKPEAERIIEEGDG